MSNLGLYQTMTTLSKKVGGPANFILIVLGLGYGIGRATEAGIKKAVKAIKANSNDNRSAAIYYHILTAGESNDGLVFSVGDTFQVLERDKDAVLIKKLGDGDNPYFVSAELLCSISDYEG